MTEETELLNNSYNNIKDIEDIAKNPVTKFLTSIMLPFWGELVSDVTIQGVNNLKVERMKSLISAIQNDDDITREQIDTIDFILRFENICRCITKASNNDKIYYFKNLIKSNIATYIDIDETDEFSDSLDRLSIKDINILATLYKYLVENEFKTNESLSTYNTKWAKLVNSYEEGKDSFLSHCCRLSGFGFCKEYVGGYLDYIGGTFILTEYGDKFVQSILYQRSK